MNNILFKKIPALNYYLVVALILSMVVTFGIKYLLEKLNINQYYLSLIKIIPMSVIVYLLITYLRPFYSLFTFSFN